MTEDIFNQDSLIQFLASIAIIGSVYNLSKGHLSGWVLSIVGSGLYSLWFYQNHLYASSAIQFVFVIQSITGLALWQQSMNKYGKFESIKIDKTYITPFLCLLFVSSLVFSVLMFELFKGSIFDYQLSFLSIVALILMIYRVIQSWFVWIIVNIGYVFMFMHLEIWILATLNVVLMILSINGYLAWKKSLKTV